MSLYPRHYELLICPVCREQVDEDYEMGARHWHKGYHGDIEPVKVTIPVPGFLDGLLSAPPLKEFLAEKIRKQERHDGQMEWWRALPQEEKDRREAERRAGMSPMALALEDTIRAASRESLLSRISWTDPVEVKVEPGTAVGGILSIPTEEKR